MHIIILYNCTHGDDLLAVVLSVCYCFYCFYVLFMCELTL